MKKTSSHLNCLKKLLIPVTVFALGATAMPVSAAKFGVRVVDEFGTPLPGVAVCFGLQGNYKRYGSEFTDASGQVLVDVPNVPLLVTVSKDRFTGVRLNEPARGFNLIKQVRLSQGIPGPRCKAGSILAAPNPPAIGVDNLVVEGDDSKTLRTIVSGEPTHYRVSADSSFTDAQWKQYTSRIALGGALSGEETVFFQMRKLQGSSKSWLEARSSVVTVRLAN